MYMHRYINFVFFMSYETLFFHVDSHGESTATRPPCTRHIFTDMVFKRHCLSARVVPQRSRQIQFRGSVRVFYHSPDRQGMQNYLCFIITKSSLCPVSFFMSSLQHQASHSTGSTFWGRALGHRGARGLLRLAHSGRRKGGEGGGGSTLALGCTSLHFCSLFCPGSRPSSLCRPGALPAGSVALPWQRPRGKHALPLRPDEGPPRVALRTPPPAPSAPPSSPRFL